MENLNSKQKIQKVDKPWGYELIWAKTNDYVGKLLFIKKGHQLSLQYHEIKEETIFVHTGLMKFIVGDHEDNLKEVLLHPGEAFHIPVKKRHRMIAVEDCTVFEVSTPHLDDVVRIEDSYGRVAPIGNSKEPS
jgi:mannose-6-phosphate isomerase